TDRDGLPNLRECCVGVYVGPDLLVRGINVCDALLKAAGERGCGVGLTAGSGTNIIVGGEPPALAVTENSEPAAEVKVRPVNADHERQPEVWWLV
ncbi:MAG: hypothetical protein ABJC09_15425, partial [Terriglobia bacterium]